MTKLVTGEGMDQSRFPTGVPEGILHGPMIDACLFDGDENIPELMLLHGLPNARDRSLKVGLNVRKHGGRYEYIAKEVAKDEFGAQFGAVNADDAEMLGPNRLNTLMDLAVGFVHEVCT